MRTTLLAALALALPTLALARPAPPAPVLRQQSFAALHGEDAAPDPALAIAAKLPDRPAFLDALAAHLRDHTVGESLRKEAAGRALEAYRTLAAADPIAAAAAEYYVACVTDLHTEPLSTAITAAQAGHLRALPPHPEPTAAVRAILGMALELESHHEFSNVPLYTSLQRRALSACLDLRDALPAVVVSGLRDTYAATQLAPTWGASYDAARAGMTGVLASLR